MTEPALYWLASVASLVGVWLNIRKRAACFAIWTVTNAAWAWADFTHGLPQQGTLHLVYVGLAVYGLVEWNRRREPADIAS